MRRMEYRSYEAPMDWEREQDSNKPSIFDAPMESPVAQHSPSIPFSGRSNGESKHHQEFKFSSTQSGHNNRPQSPGWGSVTPKPFRQDSQLSSAEDPTNTWPVNSQRQSSFQLSRPVARTASASSDRGQSPKRSGGLLDMGSLTEDILGGEVKPLASKKTTIEPRVPSLRYRNSGFIADEDNDDDDIQSKAVATLSDNGGSESEGDSRLIHRRRMNPQRLDNRWRYQGQQNGFSRQSSIRETNLNDPYYQQQQQPQPVTPHARAWSENVDLPFILAGYVQVAMNTAIVGILLYLIFNFITTIQSDVSFRMDSMMTNERNRIQKCREEYVEYNCIVPKSKTFAMCEEFKSCMNQPEPRILRASVSAETLALIVNAFVHTISFKTMMFVFVLVFGGLYMSNQALSAYRLNHVVHHQHTMAPGNGPSLNNYSSSTNTSAASTGTRYTRERSLDGTAKSIGIADRSSLLASGGSSMNNSPHSHILSKSMSLQHFGRRSPLSEHE
ncbi:hypothetical protein BGZ94_001324 [Podila epigama]|nr:hypothetical protein BGZ94_001324 [Podila epigama]